MGYNRTETSVHKMRSNAVFTQHTSSCYIQNTDCSQCFIHRSIGLLAPSACIHRFHSIWCCYVNRNGPGPLKHTRRCVAYCTGFWMEVVSSLPVHLIIKCNALAIALTCNDQYCICVICIFSGIIKYAAP